MHAISFHKLTSSYYFTKNNNSTLIIRWFGFHVRRPMSALVRKCESMKVGVQSKGRGGPLTTKGYTDYRLGWASHLR